MTDLQYLDCLVEVWLHRASYSSYFVSTIYDSIYLSLAMFTDSMFANVFKAKSVEVKTDIKPLKGMGIF